MSRLFIMCRRNAEMFFETTGKVIGIGKTARGGDLGDAGIAVLDARIGGFQPKNGKIGAGRQTGYLLKFAAEMGRGVAEPFADRL